ncbi:MAG: phosphoadenosine phosphosulfate reductase family protein [Candidatus Micrarchaeales archaeon]
MAKKEMNEKEFIDQNNLGDKFTAARTQRCEDLMVPEAKALLNLPLEEKVKKSQEIIKEALKKYKNVGLGWSGGTDSRILLAITLPLKRDIPTVFVDTQHEFPETYRYVDDVRRELQLTNHTTVMASQDREKEFEEKYGLKTPEFTTECCNYHKITPMMDAIRKFKFDAFLVGLRGVEHEERAKEVFFSPRHNPDHIRVHPLLFWRKEDILEYVKKYNIKCNPMYAKGYTSLGCTICTSPNTDPNAHERAGRGVVRETVMKRLRELGYT